MSSTTRRASSPTSTAAGPGAGRRAVCSVFWTIRSAVSKLCSTRARWISASLACDPRVRRASPRVHQLFARWCAALGFTYVPEVVDDLLARHYYAAGRRLRRCHPRDLLGQIRNYCVYNDLPLEMRPEYFDRVVKSYFTSVMESPAAGRAPVAMAPASVRAPAALGSAAAHTSLAIGPVGEPAPSAIPTQAMAPARA